MTAPLQILPLDRELFLALRIFETCGEAAVLAGVADDSFEMQRIAEARIASQRELVEALKGLTSIVYAMRYTAGLGKTQLERLEAAEALIAKLTVEAPHG